MTNFHLHYERIAWEDHKLIGRCQLCPLVREYDPEGIEPPAIIREGNMEDELKPKNWDTMSNQEKGKFFIAHKAEIVEDLKTLGHTATRKKWGMAGSTLAALKKRWHIGDEGALPSGQEVKKAVQPSDGLPPLPAWNDNWPESVQLRWLGIWESQRVKV